jgi:hypothetical protein
MTEVQTEAAFQSLAEELSRLSHAPPLAPSEHQHELDEGWNLTYLFRVIPSLCPHDISALHRFDDCIARPARRSRGAATSDPLNMIRETLDEIRCRYDQQR